MVWLELVWLGLLSLQLDAARMTLREQLILEVMDWCEMGEQGARELQGVRENVQGTAEEEGGGTAVMEGEKGLRWGVIKEQTNSS